MSAKPVHLFRRLVFALALLACLVLSAWSVSSPVQAAPAHSTCQATFAAKLKPQLVARMQQVHIPGTIIYVDDPNQGCWTTALGIGNLASRKPMQVNNYMRQKKGYLGHKLHRSLAPDARFRFVNVARWASVQEFQAAHDEGFRALVSQPVWAEFRSFPTLYEVFHEGEA